MQATRRIIARAAVSTARNSETTTSRGSRTVTTRPSRCCFDHVNATAPAVVSSRRLSTATGGGNDWEGRMSASSGDDKLRGLNKEEVVRVGARTQQMWKDHVALTTDFPEASLPPGAEGKDAVSPEIVRRKRLVYRSKQRGWLEVDLLLGTWAEQNVPSLAVEEMDGYEDILNLETVDIFNFITGNAQPPAFVDTPMMARLQAYVRSNPLGQGPDNYESVKRMNNLT